MEKQQREHQEQELIQKTARDFANTYLLPGVMNRDENQKFPKDALIGGVTRKGKSLIPNGDFRIRTNDRVVVLCAKDMIHKVEKFFK